MIICKRSTITALVVGLLITVCLPLPAQNEAGPSAATVSTATQVDLESEKAGKIDWGEQIMKGEEIAFVLIFAAVAGLAFFLERLYSVRRRHFVPGKRAEELIGIWQSGDFERAWMRAQKDPSIFGRAAEYIAGHTHLSFEIVSFSASDIVSRSVGRQLQRTYPLAIVATVSPLLGLLGTIIGMIEAFQKVAIMGDTGDASVLADSIGKALITTAIGLIVAIPALSAYHFFKMKINNLGIQIEEAVDAMLAVWLQPDEEATADAEAGPTPDSNAGRASEATVESEPKEYPPGERDPGA